MVAISITNTDVTKASGSADEGIAGEVIDAGEAVYRKPSDNKFYLADALAASVAGDEDIDNVHGIALNDAVVANQPLSVQTSGVINVGAATCTVGLAQYLMITAGGITETVADLTAGDTVTLIGFASTAAAITLGINRTNIATP